MDEVGVGWCHHHGGDSGDAVATNPFAFDYWWASATLEPDVFQGLDHNHFPPGYAGSTPGA